MFILKVLLCLVFLVIVPIIVGEFFTKSEEKPHFLYAFIYGNILEMAIFFVISIPLILLKAHFTTLVYLYMFILTVVTILSIKFNKDKILSKHLIITFKPKFSIYKLVAFALIFLQLFIKIKYANVNNDDSSFVTLSTDMIQSNTMYLVDANGNMSNSISPRRALAPLSAYFAFYSQILHIHVTILTHTIVPIVYLVLAYSVYYCFAKKVFKDDEDSIFIFLSLLCMLNLFAFSVKGYNRYLILYTWFGRAILAGIILPLIWTVQFDAMKNEKNIIEWFKLFSCTLAGCLCSSMAVPLVSISLVALSLISGVRDKKISYFIKSCVCIIPCAIIGALYLIMK